MQGHQTINHRRVRYDRVPLHEGVEQHTISDRPFVRRIRMVRVIESICRNLRVIGNDERFRLEIAWRNMGGDANAALGLINRKRLGKTRHIDTGLLWVQQVAVEQRLKFKKVLGTNNPADLFTKHLDEKLSKHHVTNLGYQRADGRAEEAPQLQTISVSIDEHLSGNNHQDWECLQFMQGNKQNVKDVNAMRRQPSHERANCLSEIEAVETLGRANVLAMQQQHAPQPQYNNTPKYTRSCATPPRSCKRNCAIPPTGYTEHVRHIRI